VSAARALADPLAPTVLPSPRQARSRQALGQLLEAGEALLEEDAFESASIAEIAARAGSSVGSFYRLVGDKDRLLRAVHARFLDASHALLEERLDPAHFTERSAGGVVHAFVAFLAEVYASREGLLRALIVRSSSDRAFRLGVHTLNDAVEARLAGLLAARPDEVGHPRPEEAVPFGVKVVLGALNQNVLVHSPELRDGQALVRELARVLCAYLAIEPE
jgi:AcrR family transcriptional regulator